MRYVSREQARGEEVWVEKHVDPNPCPCIKLPPIIRHPSRPPRTADVEDDGQVGVGLAHAVNHLRTSQGATRVSALVYRSRPVRKYQTGPAKPQTPEPSLDSDPVTTNHVRIHAAVC